MYAGLSLIITLGTYALFKFSYIKVDAGFYPLMFLLLMIFLQRSELSEDKKAKKGMRKKELKQRKTKQKRR